MGANQEIQQALHGYSEGHRKLASSCRLPKDAERQILILSDLSGPGGGNQFDPYLTGYPVEKADYYALARTWPAPEMGRPGCVWTHTLLIGTDLLAELNQPEILSSLFRHPSREEGFNAYHETVRLPSHVEQTLERDGSLGAQLICALYGRTSPYTVLPVPRYSVAEAPFLSVWRVQWPGLRQRFTFCTGVRSRRSLEGEVFYLQAALPRDVRRLDRGTAPLTVIGPRSTDDDYEEWIRIAVAAYTGADNSLMDFFKQVGRRLPGDTTLFRPAVQTHAILKRALCTAAVDELIRYTAKEYPEPDAGENYKRAFLGENLAGLPEAELVKGLSLTEKYPPFDADVLAIRGRAAVLWSSEEEAWGLLVCLLTRTCNPLGEEAILGLTSAMPPLRLREALASPREVLIGIIQREPRLACNEYLWASPEKHAFAADALSACHDQLADQSDTIIRVALEAKADPVHPTLIDAFGTNAVASVLNWLDEDPLRNVPRGWRSALAARSMEMLEWLVSHPVAHRETAYFILTSVKLDMTVASPLLTAALRTYLAGPTQDDTAVILSAQVLQTSLTNSSLSAADLASIALDIVYQAAAASRLPDNAWYGLSPFLPVSSWWQDWDRCQRLRRGIADKFRTAQWPASRLDGITKDDRLFGEIITELRQSRSGRRVIAAAAQSVGAMLAGKSC